ncbi:MAG: hypothetical protein H6707_12540 [Deltaproteobacteria bacterium]|nr:hypothetical protein [Deltaproteobacteria bacterium]
MNRRMCAFTGLAAAVMLCACGSPTELSKAQKAVGTDDWQLIGYGIERCGTTDSCDEATSGPWDSKLYAVYVNNNYSMEWAAEYIDDLPTDYDTLDRGGLSAHPTDDDKLYFLRAFGSTSYLYTYTISTSSWSSPVTFSSPTPAHYWGLGAVYSQTDLRTVIYGPGASTRALDMDPSDGSTSTVATFSGSSVYPISDNAGSYVSKRQYYAGQEAGYHYTTDLGTTGSTYYTDITEDWIVGLAANPIRLYGQLENEDYDFGCTSWEFFAATNTGSSGTTNNDTSELYLLNINSGAAEKLTFVGDFASTAPALRDLSSLPGWTSASYTAIPCLR